MRRRRRKLVLSFLLNSVLERPEDVLGLESNGVLWPSMEAVGARGAHSDDGDEDEEAADELETPQNLRLLRIGVSAVRGIV